MCTKNYNDVRKGTLLTLSISTKLWITSINRHGFVCPANERVRAKTMQKVINEIK